MRNTQDSEMIVLYVSKIIKNSFSSIYSHDFCLATKNKTLTSIYYFCAKIIMTKDQEISYWKNSCFLREITKEK